MTAFKKGDLVTKISDWDGMGTVVIENCTVYSCGKKQMIITGWDGIEHRELYRPVRGRQSEQRGWDGEFFDLRLSDDDAQTVALEFALGLIEHRESQPRSRPQHAPRAITREQAKAETEAKFASQGY